MRFTLLVFVLLLAACGSDAPPAEPPPAPPMTANPTAPPSASDEVFDVPAPADSAGLDDDPEPDEDEAPGAVIEPQTNEAAGTCDMRSTESHCMAFTGSGWTANSAQRQCTGTYQTGACPTANRIGLCIYRPDDDATREIVYTFYEPMDPLLAEGICAGTFRAL